MPRAPRRRALGSQGRESPGRGHLGPGAHREGSRRHPVRGRDRHRLPGGVLRARCRRHRQSARARAQGRRRGAHRCKDRTPGSHHQSDRHHRGVRRRDGRARRSGRGDGLRGADRPAEDHHPRVAQPQSRGDHRDADDGVDDPKPGADARRSERRRQRGDGRHRCGDALGRDGGRQISGQGRAGDGGGDPRRGEIPARGTQSRGRAEGMFGTPKRRSRWR